MSLQTLLSRRERIVAGVMSGTSLDGVDVVIARLAGSGRAMKMDLLHAEEFPYENDLVQMILENTRPQSSSVKSLSQLHVRLGQLYAEAVEHTVANSGIDHQALDLVGSHGQTVYHVSQPESFCSRSVRSTLQLGDTSVMANHLQAPVVGDFRLADMALGGEGAPLVPYFDYIRFAHETKTRLLVNIGGIANMTVLPAGGGREQVRAFDTGPGNMVINGLVRHFFGQSYDKDGIYARRGAVSEPLLSQIWEKDEFLKQLPPKSTGRAHYGDEFHDRIVEWGDQLGARAEDVIATATIYTARSVHEAYQQFVADASPVEEVIVSGGGVHNPALMEALKRQFKPIPVDTTAAYGVNPNTKEALCFAVLAHELLNGTPTNMPSVTGASRPALLGKLAFSDIS